MYWKSILFLLWLFSQTLGFVLPAAGRVPDDEAPLSPAWEQSQPANRDYDSGSPSSWVYDAVSSGVTTKTLSGLVAKVEATLAYDPTSVPSIRIVGGSRAPPLGKAGFRAAEGGSGALETMARRLERLGYDSPNANRILQSIHNGDQVVVGGKTCAE